MMTISDRAATEMKRYIDERGEPDVAIRVFVQGACGCGSASYGMGLEDEFGEDESIFELQGVKLVVDPESAPFLEGAEIDYSDGLMGRGFTIANPTRTAGGCGCGGHH
jgi:iron-sulfur cluster assembly accessory protein